MSASGLRLVLRAVLSADGRVIGAAPEVPKKTALLFDEGVLPWNASCVVMIDEKGALTPDHPILRQDRQVIVFGTSRMKAAVREGLAPLCDLWLFEKRVVAWAAIRGILEELGVASLIVPAGTALAHTLLAGGEIDAIHLRWRGTLSEEDRGTLDGRNAVFLPHLQRWHLRRQRVVGGDCLLEYARP